MNSFDFQYTTLMREVLYKGSKKETRAGMTRSVFARSLSFDLRQGLPILTTKKMFSKGVIHELLWFLKREENLHGMNIKYLVDNNVHIWDDDAYRSFRALILENMAKDSQTIFTINFGYGGKMAFDGEQMLDMSKEEFIERVKEDDTLSICLIGAETTSYKFGDLGPIYGTQWRSFGTKKIDQIQNIIDTLNNNPDDRRMLCIAYNPDVVDDVALPPCHTGFQFYSHPLTETEKIELYNIRTGKNSLPTKEELESMNIPDRMLSCSWQQRSVDIPLGLPFNIMSYAILTYMVAKVVNMVPGTLSCFLGDCHIYENQVPMIEELLKRGGSNEYPKLMIHGEQKNIDDFKYEDFEITNYFPDAKLDIPLSVGL